MDEMYTKLFIAESRENHENIIKNLLKLESNTDPEVLDEIFRAAHTLKGMGASMGYTALESLCHSMEDLLHSMRDGQILPDPELIDLLLAGGDRIEAMLDEIEAGGDGSTVFTDDLVANLRECAGEKPAKDPRESLQKSLSYHIKICLSDACSMKDIRAMIILQNLGELGTIITCNPSLEQIDAGEFGGTFALTISSDAGKEALQSAVSSSDVASAEISVVQSASPEATALQPVRIREDKPEKKDKNKEIKNIRVEIVRLDQMMNLVEDLVINSGRIKQIAKDYQIKEMDEALGMVSRSIADLQNITMEIRMIPLNHIFNRFPRVVRDIAQHDGKEVGFTLSGGETELDRSVMDGLSDPLLHLIRNAVNHGIEVPEQRKNFGKTPKGSINLSARREQGNVIIELSDDGAGIDRGRVLQKAIENSIIAKEDGSLLSDDEITALLFAPGFSTAETITDISGRGVGLDVVKRTIESLNGTITINSEPGKGTRFTLILPPTMAIVEVMMVRINGRRCAIPINRVVEVATMNRDHIHRIGNSEAAIIRDEVIQLYQLDDMFDGRCKSDTIVVVQYQGRKCCIPVDNVEGQQEVVVKPLGQIIGSCRGVSGFTIPGDGDVVPVLDVNTMV
jgi:two-component system chemotaxis sensor kinase CheA